VENMRLTSMDINNKEFRKCLRGYDQEEVDEFLDQISENYEAVYKENSTLKEKIAVLNEKLEHYAKIEATIQNTLILAQNASDQAKQSAKKEAELILRNANETSQKIIDKSNSEVIKITNDYDKIKQEFIKFRSKYRNFMSTQMDMFNDLEMDFEKNYNVATTKDIEEKTIEIPSDEIISNEFNEIDDKEDSFNNDLNEIKSFFVKE
jgi:cell division initiation protein